MSFYHANVCSLDFLLLNVKKSLVKNNKILFYNKNFISYGIKTFLFVYFIHLSYILAIDTITSRSLTYLALFFRLFLSISFTNS